MRGGMRERRVACHSIKLRSAIFPFKEIAFALSLLRSRMEKSQYGHHDGRSGGEGHDGRDPSQRTFDRTFIPPFSSSSPPATLFRLLFIFSSVKGTGGGQIPYFRRERSRASRNATPRRRASLIGRRGKFNAIPAGIGSLNASA